ncbi:hypothetical protein FQN50_008523 [Emmonsiellopsis sp. PD_5]|nr:hypothetical protein FQN50_008523 [Emmonsiellopsis sp. PD_5]
MAESASRASTALVLHGAKDLRLEPRPTPPPLPHELQISITATTLCGSDLHYYHHGRNGSFQLRSPLVLGHESAGTITALGSSVTTFSPGDRVALEVGLPCRTCTLCLRGRYNICPDLRFRSSAKTFPHLDGTLMTVTNHPAEMCHLLPGSMSDVQGALVEPLAVCLHAIHRSRPPSVEDVQLARSTPKGEETAALIFGAGAIGLLLLSALAATQHFTTLVIADIDEARLAIAAALPLAAEGKKVKTFLLPKIAVQTTEDADEDPDVAAAKTLLATFSLPHGFSRTYDCTGVASCVRTAIHATSPGGAVVQIGMGGAPQPNIPLSAAALREVDLIGVFRYDGRCYPEAVELLAGGKLEGVAEMVVTHRVPLEEGVRAFELAGKGVDGEGRAVVKVAVVGGG